jgi:hypothetical protein
MIKSFVSVLKGNQMTESFYNMKPEISDITKYVSSINVGYNSPKECWSNLHRYKRYYHNH